MIWSCFRRLMRLPQCSRRLEILLQHSMRAWCSSLWARRTTSSPVTYQLGFCSFQIEQKAKYPDPWHVFSMACLVSSWSFSDAREESSRPNSTFSCVLDLDRSKTPTFSIIFPCLQGYDTRTQASKTNDVLGLVPGAEKNGHPFYFLCYNHIYMENQKIRNTIGKLRMRRFR